MYNVAGIYILGVKRLKEWVVVTDPDCDPSDPDDECLGYAIELILQKFENKYRLRLEAEDLESIEVREISPSWGTFD